MQYTCEPGDFSEMATLMLQNEEGVVKHLFAGDELYSEKLFTAPVVFAFLAYFFFIASVTFGGAFPAGVFIPNMLMGASLGRLFGFFAEQVSPSVNKGTYALIGSAAMLSGFTRMTAGHRDHHRGHRVHGRARAHRPRVRHRQGDVHGHRVALPGREADHRQGRSLPGASRASVHGGG